MELHVRLENHWLACMASVGGGARMTRMVGGLVVANPQVAGLAFNFIALRGVQPERLPAALDIGGTLLAACGRPPAVFLAPAAGDPGRLEAALAELGWQRRVRQSVLVRSLGPTDEPELSLPGAPGITIDAVTPKLVSLWAKTLVSAYEVDPITAEHLTEAWGGLLQSPGDGAHSLGCLARFDGHPAGTGLLWRQGEIAGLYCGAVLPELRRQGIHRATVGFRLAAAAAAGCAVATLQTEAGSPVERLCTGELGFSVAYHRELWAPSEQAPIGHCE